jgi:hypothetical protein
MKVKLIRTFLSFILLGVCSLAQAATLNYSISGTGSGSLGGTIFRDANFTINMLGDTSLFNGLDIDPLTSSSVTIGGLGTTTISEGTRLGINGSIIFFSRSSGFDLFDFGLAAPVDLTQTFGSVLGTGVFALNQFNNVGSSLGLLSFSSSSNVLFQASNNVSTVPVPAALWLFGSGLLGLLKTRRKSVNSWL